MTTATQTTSKPSSKPAGAKTADKPETDPSGRRSLDERHAAVPLPPASFDVEELQKALEPVTGAKQGTNLDEARDKALRKAVDNPERLDERDRAAMPGYRVEEVKHDDLGVTERTRVFDEKQAEQDGVTADTAETKE